jgi:hypothetical protein
VQYYGWAMQNRAALMPSREQAMRAIETVEGLRKAHHGRIVIDSALPDYYARYLFRSPRPVALISKRKGIVVCLVLCLCVVVFNRY